MNLVLFRLQNLAAFRDFLLVEKYFNLEIENYNLSTLWVILFDFFTKFNIKTNQTATFLISLHFSTGFFLTFIYSQKLVYLFRRRLVFHSHVQNHYESVHKNSTLHYKFPLHSKVKLSLSPLKLSRIKNSFRRILSLILLGFSIVYIYNPFAFERILMGQYLVLVPQWLFIPFFYYFLKVWLHILEGKLESVYTYRNLVRMCFFLIIMAFSSTHGSLMWLYLIWTALTIFILYTITTYLWRKIKLLNKKASVFIWPKKQIVNMFKGHLLLAIFSTLLYFLSLLFNYNIFNSSTANFYFSFLKQNPDLLKEIIKAFSVKISEGQNLFIQVLIGSGSWNTPTFTELNSIKKDISWLEYFSVYFNSNLSIIYVLFIIATIIFSYYVLIKDRLNLRSRYFLGSLLGLVLIYTIMFSFGYSGPFEFINKIYFSTPGSYTMREAGKFYLLFWQIFASVFLLGLSLSLSFEKVWAKFRFKALFATVIFLISFSQLIPFFGLPSNYNYITYPNVWANLNNLCEQKNQAQKENEQILLLPFEIYQATSYSDIFIVNPSKYLTSCKTVYPYSVEVFSSVTNTSLPLEISEIDAQINIGVDEFEKSIPTTESSNIKIEEDPNNTSYSRFVKALKEWKIKYLVLDISKYKKVEKINQYFITFQKPILVDNQTYVYEIE